MSGTPTYLWIVEWDDRFVTPKRVEVRHLTRLEGVSDEELERHLVEVEIPAQAAAATRVGHVTRQLLLRLSGPRKGTVGYANAGDGTAGPVGDVAVSIGQNAEVVWSSADPGTDEREV
jgi:hypothetical protein